MALDNDGDIVVTILPLEQISKAERKLNSLRLEGKQGCLVCLRKPGGVSLDVIEVSELQKRALETVTRYFKETGKGKQTLSVTVKKVLNKVKETVSG